MIFLAMLAWTPVVMISQTTRNAFRSILLRFLGPGGSGGAYNCNRGSEVGGKGNCKRQGGPASARGNGKKGKCKRLGDIPRASARGLETLPHSRVPLQAGAGG